ncbi:MAG: hypothetical protein ACFFFB_14085 [Candidatus Heimdallarchaeota archaeon]
MNNVNSKLKLLIHLCKQTHNFKKLAVVGFVLLSNTIDEIGAYLGFRPRKKKENEHLYSYLEFINETFYNFIKSPIFQTSTLERLKLAELMLLKLRGEISYDQIKEIFTLYYELQEMDVPDIYQVLGDDIWPEHRDLNLFMVMTRNKKNESDNNKARQLLLHKIRQREVLLQKTLQQRFHKSSFEEAIHMKQLETSITKQKKILSFSGNNNRIRTFCLGCVIIGAIIFFFLLGSVILYEMIMFPYLTFAISLFLVIFFGSGFLTLLLYLKFFFRGEK